LQTTTLLAFTNMARLTVRVAKILLSVCHAATRGAEQLSRSFCILYSEVGEHYSHSLTTWNLEYSYRSWGRGPIDLLVRREIQGMCLLNTFRDLEINLIIPIMSSLMGHLQCLQLMSPMQTRQQHESSRVRVRRTERSRVKSSPGMLIVLVIKVKYMYHIQVSPDPTNRNADIHESGALPFLSLPTSFAA
jgi:hypothetical protein